MASNPSYKADPKGKNPLESNTEGRPYWYHIRFVTNSSAAPDGVIPAYSDHTVARTGAGVYTITLTTAARPEAVMMGLVEPVDTSTLNMEWYGTYRGYASGVFTVAVGNENTTSGVVGAADSTDITVNCAFLCNGNAL